jgi:hypothetical protein
VAAIAVEGIIIATPRLDSDPIKKFPKLFIHKNLNSTEN